MSNVVSWTPLAQLALVMGVAFAVLGALMALLRAAFHWPSVARHRSRQEFSRTVDVREHERSMRVNSALSTSIYLIATFVFFESLLYAGPVPVGRMIAEAIGLLLVYDLLYYGLHRYVFHEWEIGRRWHGVHHRIRSPRAEDSLFIHPMETFLGVLTFLISLAIVGGLSGRLSEGPGGVHIVGFGLAFFVYSALNIYVHSGIQLASFPFNLLAPLAAHHDVHHASMRGGYYASIAPIWDRVFGTDVEHVPALERKPSPD